MFAKVKRTALIVAVGSTIMLGGGARNGRWRHPDDMA